ncbi:MAG TPA: hypothetical protein VG845_00490 [Dehalococcoidia bacterium]|nr:hypothetical protein [Dehalococcoidia bacterium]
MKYLIRLYPRAWRARYGDEFAALVEDQPLRPGLLLDILAGAIDAHVSPQCQVELEGTDKSRPGGHVMRLLAIRCAAGPRLSTAEQLLSALLVVGTAAGMSLIYLWVNRAAPDNLYVEALGLATFPISVIVGMMPFYLRDHSRVARTVLTVGALTLAYLGSLLAAWT